MPGAALGYGELAIKHTEAASPSRRYLEKIVRAGTRAAALVARILAFSRPGIGDSAPVLLQKIITEVRSLTCASLPAGITLVIEVPSEPIVVAGDAAQLHQMLANLVTNAVQAVAEPGRVVIRATALEGDAERDCTVGRLRPMRYPRVDIVDSRVGMSAAQVERSF